MVAKQKEVYNSGVYTPHATIFHETIASHGVTGLDVTFVYTYRATYDYGCFFLIILNYPALKQ